jgi:hypothetical protein
MPKTAQAFRRSEVYCGATSVLGAGNGDAIGAGSGAREQTD